MRVVSALGGALFLLVSVSNSSIAQEAVGTLYYYDSGWQGDDSYSSHETVFEHGLGVIPTDVTIWFAPALDATGDAEEVHPLNWSWASGSSGNPVSIIMGADAVKLTIWSGAFLHGFWTPSDGWQKYRTGYWRVIARP